MEFDKKDIQKARLFRIKDLFAHYGLNLIYLSYFFFCSSLLLVAWFVSKSFFDSQIIAGFAEASEAEKQIMINTLFSNQIIYGLIFIPLVVITFSLLSGCINLSYKINIYQREDYFKTFFSGVKSGMKYSIVCGIFVGIIYNVVNTLLFYQNITNQYVYYIVFALSIFIFFPLISIILYIGVIYNPSIFVAIKNGSILYFRYLLYTLCIIPLTGIPIILLIYFKNEIWVYILYVIFSVFVFGYLLTILTEIMLDMFDETVNKFHHKDMYLKGFDIKDNN